MSKRKKLRHQIALLRKVILETDQTSDAHNRRKLEALKLSGGTTLTLADIFAFHSTAIPTAMWHILNQGNESLDNIDKETPP